MKEGNKELESKPWKVWEKQTELKGRPRGWDGMGWDGMGMGMIWVGPGIMY